LLLLGVDFKSEETLQKQGFAKTPDCYFSVPQLVTLANSGKQVLATWIDSKATFGGYEVVLCWCLKVNDDYFVAIDAFQLRTASSQLLSYRQRFGPGVVLLWFGYVESLAQEWRDKGIYLTDAFPALIEAV
jgi:hypothetical protein